MKNVSIEIALGGLLAALSTLISTINLWLATKIKRETSAVNTAVNHVEEGKLPLTRRIDRIEETLVVVEYDQRKLKETITNMDTKLDKSYRLTESLLKAATAVKEKKPRR